jgi:3-oxoacyl-[acyl-carrier-protein] synthase II
VRELPRVVVTGVGMVSPLGPLPLFWERVRAGASGIGPIDWFDTGPSPPDTAARVRDWQPKEHIKPAALRRMDRFSQMVVSACRMALADAAFAPTSAEAEAEAMGVVVGAAYGNLLETETFLRGVIAKGPALANPMLFPNLVLNAPAGYVAIELGLRGPNFTVCHSEISGEAALALAYDTIVCGRADVVLAGGGDEISPVLFHVSKDFGVLSPGRRRKGGAATGREWSSPFDRDRNGMVMGEGAAMLVLERAEHARARGAVAYAELVGHAAQTVPSSPHLWPRATAAAPRATAEQLRALRGVDEVDLIVSCANSTRDLDAFEAAHLAALLGESAPRALVTSVKGAIGEFGGAGAFSVAVAALALRDCAVPPLAALRRPDPACTLRLVTADTPAPGALRAALVSGTARGGACTTLLLARP